MKPLRWAVFVAGLLLWAGAPVRAAGEYPLALVANAQATNGTTTITSVLTIQIDRLISEGNRTRVTDALKFGGYQNFFTALRKLPAIGRVEIEKRRVDIRYAREEKDDKGMRLVLVADKPLFFLGEAVKNRAGYELTVVELSLDAQGAGTGRMLGAARVKPAPDGSVVVDDFASTPVQLTVRKASAK